MANYPSTAIWNLGNLYLQGMRMTYVDTTHFTVDQGAARDSTDINDIVLALPPENNGTPVFTPFTVNIGQNGVNGLDTGTVAASTLYYVFAIASSNNSHINLPPSPLQSLSVPPFTTPSPTSPVVQDGFYVQSGVLMSLSLTNPLLPYGYDMFRRIGCVRINSASHVEPFTQSGYGQNRTMRYQTPVAPGTAGTPATTFATIGALLNVVPQTKVDVLVDVSIIGNSIGNAVYLGPYGITSTGYETLLGSFSTSVAQLGQVVCPCEFNAAGTPVVEIDYKLTSASDTVVFLINGYVDAL